MSVLIAVLAFIVALGVLIVVHEYGHYLVARLLGIDPVALRRANLVPPERMPYANGSETDGHPVVYDSGDYPRLLEHGLEAFGWDEMRAWRTEPARDDALRRGVGLAFFVEKSGIAQWEYARME